jgi:transposase-like protein
MAQRPDLGKQERWLELIRRWQRSPTTIREFCERHHIKEASFFSWRRVLRERGLLPESPLQAEAASFVKLTVAPSPTTHGVEVVLGKRVLRVRPGFDANLLLELVRLLEEPAC